MARKVERVFTDRTERRLKKVLDLAVPNGEKLMMDTLLEHATEALLERGWYRIPAVLAGEEYIVTDTLLDVQAGQRWLARLTRRG